MDSITVREVNAEINIFLGRNCPTRLSALEEASKILQRELVRERSHSNERTHSNDSIPRESNSNELPGSEITNG